MRKQTPLIAIKENCKWCMDGSLKYVRECGDGNCPLLPLREGKSVKGISPLKTIRAKCLECVETPQYVKECPGQMYNGFCPLHPYRFGKKSRTLSEAERKQRQNALDTAGQEAIFEAESETETQAE